MKYIYINKKLRVKVTHNSYGQILLELQTKSFWFWFDEHINVTLLYDDTFKGKDDRHIDLMGALEIHNSKTFDIKKSAYKLAQNHIDKIEKQKKAKQLISQISIIMIIALFGCKPKTPPVNYQSQLDSLNGVISIQDKIIESMVNDLDSLIELKEKVRYVQGKKIIEYRTITTPERVQKLAERL